MKLCLTECCLFAAEEAEGGVGHSPVRSRRRGRRATETQKSQSLKGSKSKQHREVGLSQSKIKPSIVWFAFVKTPVKATKKDRSPAAKPAAKGDIDQLPPQSLAYLPYLPAMQGGGGGGPPTSAYGSMPPLPPIQMQTQVCTFCSIASCLVLSHSCSPVTVCVMRDRTGQYL
jgi:hypothetical protein